MVFKQFFIPTLTACSLLPFLSCPATPRDVAQALTRINRAAFLGDAEDLETACKEHPLLDLNRNATYEKTLIDSFLTPHKPDNRLACPLWWATQSAYDVPEKIAYLQIRGASLTPVDSQQKLNPFWAAVVRHNQQQSDPSRAIVVAMLHAYPEAYQLTLNNKTVLAHAATDVDTELVSHILHTTHTDPQQLRLYPVPNRQHAEETALQTLQQTSYRYSWPTWLQPVEKFFPAAAFKSRQRACQVLLCQALKIEVDEESDHQKKD